MWRTAATDGVIAVHFGYLAYLVVGGFLAWRWPKTIGLHVIAAIWAGLIVGTHVPCPLTALQNTLREQSGEHPLADSFINVYVRGHVFPTDAVGVAQGLVGGIVLASWAGFLLRQHNARVAGSAAT
jgi:hypothetical protein